MLHIEGLQFTYDGAPLLRDINLDVPAGQSVFLLGPSGEGKSTILRCIAGLESPEHGTIALDGESIRGRPVHERRVGMIMQEAALFPHLNAWRNVAFGLKYRNVPKQEQRQEAIRYLELVGLPGKADASVDELSGGERQRVAVARTLAAKPRAVLLDEPLSALHRELRDDLGTSIRDLLRDEGVPALWVTHDEAEARRLGDGVWRLHDGVLHHV